MTHGALKTNDFTEWQEVQANWFCFKDHFPQWTNVNRTYYKFDDK